MNHSDKRKGILRDMELAAQQPERVGMSSAQLHQIDKMIRKAMWGQNIPGAVALVARHQQVSYFKSWGVNSLESSKPLQKDDIFAVASMTKAITTVAAMMLYEEGKFSLEQPLSEFIPEFKEMQILGDSKHPQEGIMIAPSSQEITIRQLLNHTSGMGYPFLDPRLRAISHKQGGLSPTLGLRANMQFFAKLPLLHEPGQRWTYGYSTDVLGGLIEIWSGLGLDEYFQKRIFEPMAMYNTGFSISREDFPRLVACHTKTPAGKLCPIPRRFPADINFFSGGGGLLSNAPDYARFLQMLLNGGILDGHRILKAETVQMMTQNQIGELHAQEKQFSFLSGQDKFGFGFLVYDLPKSNVRQVNPGSYGWAGSYNTWYWVDPEEDLYGILLTQTLPFADRESVALYHKFQEIVYESIED